MTLWVLIIWISNNGHDGAATGLTISQFDKQYQCEKVLSAWKQNNEKGHSGMCIEVKK